jgi:hypothetical protein
MYILTKNRDIKVTTNILMQIMKVGEAECFECLTLPNI